MFPIQFITVPYTHAMRRTLVHLCSIVVVALFLAGCGLFAPEAVARENIHTSDFAYLNEDNMQYSLTQTKLIDLPPRVYPDGSVSSHDRQILATIFEVSNRSDRTQALWRADRRRPPIRQTVFLAKLEDPRTPRPSYEIIDRESLSTIRCPSQHMNQRLASFRDVDLYSGDTVTAALCWHNNGEIHLDNYDVLLIKATSAHPASDNILPFKYPWNVFAIPDEITQPPPSPDAEAESEQP